MVSLPRPTGTVTFLFTDIEGSTRRWEATPIEMGPALELHNSLLQGAIEQRGGYIFKTVGDAFCAAFPSPHAALLAALLAQSSLQETKWPEKVGPVRVRMALHTGAVDEQGGDYFGQPLNRVARLLSAGHGGQVLLSEVTHALVRDNLPSGVAMRDLGEHRLKDLIRPEHIFQVVTSGLPADFPPLRTLEASPNNLPAQPTPLVGRETEVEAISSLLTRAEVRLVTLTGPGGIGKSRLALQVAAEVLEHFSDGAFFVNLAPITDASLVVSTIAHTLGIQESGSQPLVETLKEYLRDRKLLLLPDNFEQVIEAAPLLAELLASAHGLRVLVTSREILRLRGEKEYEVPPLSVPDMHGLQAVREAREGHDTLTGCLPSSAVERLTQYDAVRLFIERATDARAGFEVTNENAPAVAEICVRLDGLPLAIELAAARVRMFPPQALLERLGHSLSLLTGGARDLPARQRTLRNAIEWSYNLLTEGEQQLFRRMAVFGGGGTLEALEAVCNFDGDLQVDMLDGVESLLEKSLLKEREGRGREPRYWMLETIHEYAREVLEQSEETERLRRAHASYFLAIAEQGDPWCDARVVRQTSPAWVDAVEDEHDNFREAIDWAVQAAKRSGDEEDAGDMALRLAALLEEFWQGRGYLSEGRAHLEAALNAVPSSRRTLSRARALITLATLHFPMAEYEPEQARGEEALAIARELGNVRAIAESLFEVAVAAGGLGDWERQRALLTESLPLFKQLGADRMVATVLVNLFAPALQLGDVDEAKRLLEEALLFSDRAKIGTAFVHENLGYLALLQGDYSSARSYLEPAVKRNREAASKYRLLCCLGMLSDLELVEGDYSAAKQCLDEASELSEAMTLNNVSTALRFSEGLLVLAQGDGDALTAEPLFREAVAAFTTGGGAFGTGVTDWLTGPAWLAAATGHIVRATRLLGAIDRRRQATPAPIGPSSRMAYERALEASRSQLSEEEFRKVWAEGEAMSGEQAVAYALQGLDNGPAGSSTLAQDGPHLGLLSRR